MNTNNTLCSFFTFIVIRFGVFLHLNETFGTFSVGYFQYLVYACWFLPALKCELMELRLIKVCSLAVVVKLRVLFSDVDKLFNQICLPVTLSILKEFQGHFFIFHIVFTAFAMKFQAIFISEKIHKQGQYTWGCSQLYSTCVGRRFHHGLDCFHHYQRK